MQVWNVLHAPRWKYRTKNSPSVYHRTTLSAISSQLRHISTIRKNMLNSSISSTCPLTMVNFGTLTAQIGWWVWGTPANFNGFPLMDAGCNNMQDDSTDPAARTVAAFTSNNRMSSPVNKEHLPLLTLNKVASHFLTFQDYCLPQKWIPSMTV